MLHIQMWICLLSTALLILVQAEEGDVFVAKEDWQEIREGQKVPGGLHYRMNLETGKKEAKLLSQDDPDSSKETGAVLSDANEPVEETKPLNPEQLAMIRAKMKKMEFNRDVEQIKFLIAHYENSTFENKKIILEELDYFLHQYDNANDFISLDGFPKIVIPAFNSQNEELIEGAAILLGSAAQSNTKVQAAAEKAGFLKTVLELFETWSGKSDKVVGRLVFTLSSLVRGNLVNLETFNQLQGQEILLRHMTDDTSSKVVVKIFSFIADILSANDWQQNMDKNWCWQLLQKDLLSKDDLDHVEKFVHCLVNFRKFCQHEMAENVELRRWILNARQVVRQNQESESDFEKTLSGIEELLTFLNLTKTEL